MKGEIKRYVGEVVEGLVLFIREEYKLKKFEVETTVSFDNRRKYSWGGTNKSGQPFINIAVDYHACKMMFRHRKKISLFEYSDYEDHPIIGSVPTANWKLYIYRVVAHELAHCVELYPMSVKKRLRFHKKASLQDNPESGHGKLFQEIYVTLMNNWQQLQGSI